MSPEKKKENNNNTNNYFVETCKTNEKLYYTKKVTNSKDVFISIN